MLGARDRYHPRSRRLQSSVTILPDEDGPYWIPIPTAIPTAISTRRLAREEAKENLVPQAQRD